MEVQVIYFARDLETPINLRKWVYVALPVPTAAADIKNITPNILNMLDSMVDMNFLGFLGSLFGEDWAMKGWKPYHIAGPPMGPHLTDRAKVIVVRDQASRLPQFSEDEHPSVKCAIESSNEEKTMYLSQFKRNGICGK